MTRNLHKRLYTNAVPYVIGFNFLVQNVCIQNLQRPRVHFFSSNFFFIIFIKYSNLGLHFTICFLTLQSRIFHSNLSCLNVSFFTFSDSFTVFSFSLILSRNSSFIILFTHLIFNILVKHHSQRPYYFSDIG